MPANRTALRSLFLRLISGGFFAVVGSLLLAVIRLKIVHAYLPAGLSDDWAFILDLIGLTMMIFGLFSALWVIPELWARLGRIDALGETDW